MNKDMRLCRPMVPVYTVIIMVFHKLGVVYIILYIEDNLQKRVYADSFPRAYITNLTCVQKVECSK